MLKHFLNPPNWFTSASMFCGLYAIVLATGVQGEPNFYRAGSMILFAGVFDMLDGRVARLTGRSSDFGLELDSLADVVSFGAAPAVLLYAWGIHGLGTLGLAGAFFFLLCGAFRLARFNVKAVASGVAGTSQGLTITMAGTTVAAAVMSHAASGRVSVEHPVAVLILATALALLMVSRVPYATPKSLRLSRASLAVVALSTASILTIGLQYRWSTAFLSVLVAYSASGPIGMVLFRRQRRLAAARTSRHGEIGLEVGDDFAGPFGGDDDA